MTPKAGQTYTVGTRTPSGLPTQAKKRLWRTPRMVGRRPRGLLPARNRGEAALDEGHSRALDRRRRRRCRSRSLLDAPGGGRELAHRPPCRRPSLPCGPALGARLTTALFWSEAARRLRTRRRGPVRRPRPSCDRRLAKHDDADGPAARRAASALGVVALTGVGAKNLLSVLSWPLWLRRRHHRRCLVPQSVRARGCVCDILS